MIRPVNAIGAGENRAVSSTLKQMKASGNSKLNQKSAEK
jgi:hypothetical protein